MLFLSRAPKTQLHRSIIPRVADEPTCHGTAASNGLYQVCFTAMTPAWCVGVYRASQSPGPTAFGNSVFVNLDATLPCCAAQKHILFTPLNRQSYA